MEFHAFRRYPYLLLGDETGNVYVHLGNGTLLSSTALEGKCVSSLEFPLSVRSLTSPPLTPRCLAPPNPAPPRTTRLGRAQAITARGSMVSIATNKGIAMSNINRLIANGATDQNGAGAPRPHFHARPRFEWCRGVDADFTAATFDIMAPNILYGGTSTGEIFVFNTRSQTFSDG